jgi:multiple sugar transport system permease protein
MSALRTPPLSIRIAVHAVVYLGAATMMLPLAWMVLTSLKTDAEAASAPTWGSLLPSVPQWGNYLEAVQAADLDQFYWNSTLAALLTTVLGVGHNALAGFAFAKLRFAGKRVLFGLALATMMVPIQVYFIFAYIICSKLGFVDNIQALIVPFLASGFGIFYIRQAMNAVPDSLIEAGRLDGMNEFDIFWYVARPIIWPAIASLGVFTFVFSWNNLFWPLIVVDSERSKTLPLAIADLSAGQYVDSWPVQMAAGTILIIPLVVVFFLLQRAFVQGVAVTGIKE